jgi:predicted DCC family thiol-disulfide oxidoreductase YuxK
MPPAKLKMYFDGHCYLCAGEVNHYRKQKGNDQIEFVDIAAPGFRPEAEGLDPVKVNREMHVRRSDGTLAVGVDAFIAVWETLPRYHWLAKIARLQAPHWVLGVGYQLFVRIRPYLPRRKVCPIPPVHHGDPK